MTGRRRGVDGRQGSFLRGTAGRVAGHFSLIVLRSLGVGNVIGGRGLTKTVDSYK